MVYVQRNPKREATKHGECESYQRYERYKECTALRDVINISVLSRPKGMTQGRASALAMRDIKWDYERGFMYFPLNESGRLGHWVDAKVIAADRGVIGGAMRFPGERAEVAMSGVKSEVTRQFDWPQSKNAKVVFNDMKGVWVSQNTEVQAFGNILNEAGEEDEEQAAAIFGKGGEVEGVTSVLSEHDFGTVLEQQYHHDGYEW